MSLLCDRMTCDDGMAAINAHGINNDDIGPIAKASFEETPAMFLKAATYAELDNMRGVSANVMCGQEGYFGTSAFQVLLSDFPAAVQDSRNDWFSKKTAAVEMPLVYTDNSDCATLNVQNSAVDVFNVMQDKSEEVALLEDIF